MILLGIDPKKSTGEGQIPPKLAKISSFLIKPLKVAFDLLLSQPKRNVQQPLL